MRIGVFMGEFTPQAGGGYTFVSDVADAFFASAQHAAHEFVVFCQHSAMPSLQARCIAGNVRFVALPRRGIVGKAICALKHLSPLFAVGWRFQSALERAARTHGVELLWFVGGFYDSPDVPYVATVWDVQHLTHPWFPEVSAGGRWDYRDAFIRRHLRRATRIITGTTVGREQLTRYFGVPEDRICILPHPTPAFALNAYTIDAAALRARFGLREGFLFYPAQFWAHKNHITILHALKHLKDSGKPLPDLALVGSDKGNQDYVLAEAERLGVRAQVHCLGFVSIEELVGLYKASAGLLYASFSGPENLPPLEAFALGCPVANADFPGAREQLGDAALYFNPHDPQSIAEAMLSLLAGGDVCASLVAAGHTRARRWTSKEYVERCMQLFDSFTSERRCWSN